MNRQPLEWQARSLLRGVLRGTGTTQAELARRTGYSEKHISRVVNGHAGMSMDLADELLAALGFRARLTLEPTGPAR